MHPGRSFSPAAHICFPAGKPLGRRKKLLDSHICSPLASCPSEQRTSPPSLPGAFALVSAPRLPGQSQFPSGCPSQGSAGDILSAEHCDHSLAELWQRATPSPVSAGSWNELFLLGRPESFWLCQALVQAGLYYGPEQFSHCGHTCFRRAL